MWTDDEIIVELAGAKLAGRVELRRQADRAMAVRVEDAKVRTSTLRVMFFHHGKA